MITLEHKFSILPVKSWKYCSSTQLNKKIMHKCKVFCTNVKQYKQFLNKREFAEEGARHICRYGYHFLQMKITAE